MAIADLSSTHTAQAWRLSTPPEARVARRILLGGGHHYADLSECREVSTAINVLDLSDPHVRTT